MAKPYSVVARTSVISLALGVVGLFVAWREGRLPSASAHHSPEELEAFRGGGSTALAIGQNTYFMASGNCQGCHGPDELNNFSMVDADGNDVNVGG